MATYREQGIVLRTHKLGETDRILHLVTQGRGKVRAVAKGVRRPGSRFGGRLEPYSHVDLQLYEGRNLDVVNQAELIAPHAAVRADYALSASAATMTELTDAVAQEGERDNALFLLLRAGLQALEAAPPDPAVFVDAFLLRLASIVGFHAFTEACAVCRTPGRHVFLSVKAGGTLCADCAPTGTRAVDRDVVEAVRLLGAPGEWAALPALSREQPDAGRVAASYVRAFVEHHLDRRLRSYELVPRQ
ncbi:DNA repair protein RecO [Egicoccus halophilus]|uniref:DNA repair protein RecO n=1 Tax=Egicoccus halophilus TaxID=1670830 RepID=A0A8J3AI02_9ACTN|nr:DNA repair protein RecO [Egicoccus halophilus]GGI09219.1 DNA repair protein RecO [Egicoccus halophilus]